MLAKLHATNELCYLGPRTNHIVCTRLDAGRWATLSRRAAGPQSCGRHGQGRLLAPAQELCPGAGRQICSIPRMDEAQVTRSEIVSRKPPVEIPRALARTGTVARREEQQVI